MVQVPAKMQKFERHLCQTRLLILESLRERRRPPGPALGTEMQAAATVRITSKYHLGILPLAC